MFQSIEQQGGLQAHIESLGLDYKEFEHEVKISVKAGGKVNYSRLGRIMNKSRRTVAKWVDIYHKHEPIE